MHEQRNSVAQTTTKAADGPSVLSHFRVYTCECVWGGGGPSIIDGAYLPANVPMASETIVISAGKFISTIELLMPARRNWTGTFCRSGPKNCIGFFQPVKCEFSTPLSSHRKCLDFDFGALIFDVCRHIE